MMRELSVYTTKIAMCRDDPFIQGVSQEIARVNREISTESKASMVAILNRLTDDQLVSLNDSVAIRKHDKSSTILSKCIFERIQPGMEKKALSLGDLKECLVLIGKMLLSHAYYNVGSYDCGDLTNDSFCRHREPQADGR